LLMRKFSIFSFAFFFIATTSALAGYKVIVNPGNRISEISKKDLKRIYKMRKKKWDEGGGTIMPVNLRESNSVRKEFSKEVMGRSVKKMAAYYLKRALAGKGQPPKTMKTEKDVIDFVSSNTNAIGYVSSAAGSVKVIRVK